MGSVEQSPPIELDVLIVGAGISGINVAYRVQSELPDLTYTNLEARDVIGGTWDLFRYPGIRSDSDLYTFGYPWRPWNENKAIADGESILKYIKDSAAQFGIDKKIKFHHKLISANWSSVERKWTLQIDVKGRRETYKAKFIFLSTGYYDYDSPQDAKIPGIETFLGDVVHPVCIAQIIPAENMLIDFTAILAARLGSQRQESSDHWQWGNSHYTTPDTC